MSKDNDRPRNTWDDDDETTETPGSFDDAYLNAVNQNRPGPRSNNPPKNNAPETPGRSGGRATRPPRSSAGGGRIYEEGNEQPSRPRPTRQSRDEVYSRHRQRPHQPVYSRNQGESGSKPPARPNQGVPYRDSGYQPPVPRRARDNDPYGQQPPRRTRGENVPYQEPPASRRARDDDPYEQQSPRRVRNDDFYQEPISPRPPRPAARGAQVGSGYDSHEDESYEEYSEYDEYESAQPRRRPPARPVPPPTRKRGRGRRIFGTLFIGCLGGVITLVVVIGVVAFLILHNTPLGTTLNLGKSTYTGTPNTQTLTFGNATQLIVKNQVGNVSITVASSTSPNANAAPTLTSVKKVLASSQSDANSQYNQITLTTKQINQGDDSACLATTCLLVSATVPATQNGGILGGGNSDSIDLNIELPDSFNNLANPYTLAASTNLGSLAVSGFNGVLNLSGSVGNVDINVTSSLIFAGTCLQTTHGNVTVKASFNLSSASPQVPCTSTTTSSTHPWFSVRSGIGDVTVTTASSDLLLDANTNNGKITNAFGAPIPTSDGSATYHGPLVPGSHPIASLYVATSTGNIQMQKLSS